MVTITIPDPECHLGYSARQLDAIFGTGFVREAFNNWMIGQTMAICDGSPEREWVDDPDAPGGMRLVETGPSLCSEPHGGIVYTWDLWRYLDGGPVID